jgi:FixJ family two-component response regulator
MGNRNQILHAAQRCGHSLHATYKSGAHEMNSSLCVYIAEDHCDEAFSLQAGLERLGIESQAFPTAEALLKAEIGDGAACFVLDIGLPDMSGLNLQAELRRRHCLVPIIMISGTAMVSDAIRAFETGACAFFEKPFDVERLIDAIGNAVEGERARRQSESERSRRLAALSPRENEVLEQLIIGKGVKSIGRDLGISASTAEKHRANLLLKTGFDSVIELTCFLLSNAPRRPAMENFATRRFDRPTAPRLQSHFVGNRVHAAHA